MGWRGWSRGLVELRAFRPASGACIVPWLNMTPEQLCAQFASTLHTLPFDRDAWLQKMDKICRRMLGQSLAGTNLPDHPAYVAVHKTFTDYVKLRYRDYGSPPTGFTLLKRAAAAPKEATDLGKALDAMALVDGEFAEFVRLLVKAATARKLATK
jgi:hypothetical protein